MSDFKIPQFESGGASADSGPLRSIGIGFNVPHVCLAYVLATFPPETAADREACPFDLAFRFLTLGQLRKVITATIVEHTRLSPGVVTACLSDLQKNLKKTGREVLPPREAKRLTPALLDERLAETQLIAFLPGGLEGVHRRTLARWVKQFRRRLERHWRKAHSQAEFQAQAEPFRPALEKHVGRRLSGRSCDVEDIVQETFLAAWLQHDSKQKITFWVLRNIARELISRYWKERSPLAKVTVHLEAHPRTGDGADKMSYLDLLPDPASLPADSPYEDLDLELCLQILARVAAAKQAPWKVLAFLGFMFLGLKPSETRDRFRPWTLRQIERHLEQTYSDRSYIPLPPHRDPFQTLRNQLDQPLQHKGRPRKKTNPGTPQTLGDRKFADFLPQQGPQAQAKTISAWIGEIIDDVGGGLFGEGG